MIDGTPPHPWTHILMLKTVYRLSASLSKMLKSTPLALLCMFVPCNLLLLCASRQVLQEGSGGSEPGTMGGYPSTSSTAGGEVGSTPPSSPSVPSSPSTAVSPPTPSSARPTTPGSNNDITINPWTLGENYGNRTSTTQSFITFVWPAGQTHGVYRIPSSSCPSTFQNGLEGQEEIKAATDGPQTVTYTFPNAGTYWFACQVDGHCDLGMKFKVDVVS